MPLGTHTYVIPNITVGLCTWGRAPRFRSARNLLKTGGILIDKSSALVHGLLTWAAPNSWVPGSQLFAHTRTLTSARATDSSLFYRPSIPQCSVTHCTLSIFTDWPLQGGSSLSWVAGLKIIVPVPLIVFFSFIN